MRTQLFRTVHRLPLLAIRRTMRPSMQFVAVLVAFAIAWGAAAPAWAVVQKSDRIDGASYTKMDVPKAAMPDVRMKAGALVTEDGRVLWSRRIDDKRAMASITKLMTAIIAAEHSTPDDLVTIPKNSAKVGESTSFLRAGEKLPMSDLFAALLVKSGNDAAYAIASHISGSEAEFVELMNVKAEELGLKDTCFSNSHGLDAKSHYSSAGDLAVLARYAMTNPRIREVVGAKTSRIGTGKRAEKVTNTNLLIGNYDGANGVKTGWTSKAGYCVITSAERDGIELYAVVLDSSSELQRFRDARALLDFGFAHYRPQKLASAGTVIGQAPVSEYIDRLAPAAVAHDTTVAVFDLAGPISRTVTMSVVDAPVAQGQRIGVATFTQGASVLESVPLVSVEEVPDPTLLQRIGIAFTRAWRFVTRAG